MPTLTTLNIKFAVDTSAVDGGLSQVQNKLKQAQQQINSTLLKPQLDSSAINVMNGKLRNNTSQMKEVGQTWGRNISEGMVDVITTMGIGMFFKGLIGSFADYEAIKNSLTSIAGNAQIAADQFTRLTEIAKMPGIDLMGAARMSVKLQAAGLDAKTAEAAISSFGNAIAAAGKIGDGSMEGIGLALSQIMSKGKISAEEINQIAERVAQIRPAMKAAFGTSDTEVLQKMGLDSKTFIIGIVKELEKIPKVTGGMKNDIENLKDMVSRTAATFGEQLAPALSTTIGLINTLLGWLGGLSNITKGNIVLVVTLTAGFAIFIKGLQIGKSVILSFKEGIAGLGEIYSNTKNKIQDYKNLENTAIETGKKQAQLVKENINLQRLESQETIKLNRLKQDKINIENNFVKNQLSTIANSPDNTLRA